ncbi:surface protein [Lactococcus cremoris]|uniref:Surface protein n=1 Tax=Lactococcus lactis subsp. cremoris TaxID=1359 RepID=A0A166JWB0_LACLC|nr:GW dipeptide domain-containing protein [Lactococcus cremoris]KZK06985.1 surface protein [Lactococcus cremoris]
MKKNKLLFFFIFLVILVFGVNAKAETLTGQAQVQNLGWQTSKTVNENQILDIGTVGKGLRMEAAKFSTSGSISGGISYQAQVQNISWQSAVSNGQIAGTVGQALRMETIKISLTGSLTTSYDVYYRSQVQNDGWLGWTKDGNPSGTIGKSQRLEDLQIVLVKKGSTLPIMVDTTKNPCISVDDPLQTYQTIKSTSVYNSGTDARNYQYFALKENNRSDGLYSAPYATSNVADIPNTNAKNQNKTIVYADKAVTLSNGSSFTHINLNGTWYWVDSRALSWEQALPFASHPIQANSYNSSGQIVYYSNSKYSAQVDQAATYWNQVLGTTVFVKTTNASASNMNVKISDVQNGATGDDAYLMDTYPYKGLMFVNTSLIGQNVNITIDGKPKNFNYSSLTVIKNSFVHEFGHTLGLDHTGSTDDSGAVTKWSWSDKTDIMWAINYSGDKTSQTILTTQDIAAAKLVRSLKMYYNTTKPAYYATTTSKNSTNNVVNNPEEQSDILYPSSSLGE